MTKGRRTKPAKSAGPRITLPTAAVLREMLADPTADYYGLDLMRATGFPSGTLYPTLVRLREAGWLSSFWERGDPATMGRALRHLYRLTDVGVLAAREALDAAQHLIRATEDQMDGVRQSSSEVGNR